MRISKHLLADQWVSDTHTATPVRADAKHSFPILCLFRGHATGERFGFPAVSTADETLGTPQAEPAKLAQVEALPQLQEDIPDVQLERNTKFLA
jgi:hypothetical protein